MRELCSELNPSPKHSRLWAILVIRKCTDPHFKNRPEIVDHPGTFGILFSTYYALGHTYSNLTYYLGWIDKEKWETTSATWFSIPVLVPPSSAYFACLSLLTHLIQIISSLEVSSVHELCSHWHGPYTVFIAPYSLSRGNLLKFTSLRNIHSWICAAQRLHTRTSVTSYTSVNKYNLNTRFAHFIAFWMEHIHSLRTRIMAEYPVMSTSQGTYV